jgi:hypothetical protein
MIALLRNDSEDTQFVQQRFLAMLPQIRRQALVSFRSRGSELRAELTQEVIALAYSMFVRLVCRGKVGLAYPTPLADYAIRQVRAGRRVGCRQNAQDIMAPTARRASGPTIPWLEAHPERTGGLNLMLCEDRRAGPAETAAARLDLGDWLRKLSPRNRRIARALAVGEPTSVVARRFGLTAGRVSQLRSWFRAQWEQFQGETRPGCCGA